MCADKKGGSSGPGTGGSSAGGVGGSSGGGMDVNKLRACIQQLVKHTGPLGSCMDYIQEDIGLMNNELRKWEEACKKCVVSQ